MWYMCVTECYSAIKQSEIRRLPQRDGPRDCHSK